MILLSADYCQANDETDYGSVEMNVVHSTLVAPGFPIEAGNGVVAAALVAVEQERRGSCGSRD